MSISVRKAFLKNKKPMLCSICGLIIKKPCQASKDHEPPLSRGGKPEDWYWAHAGCNFDKGALTIPEYHLFCRLANKAMSVKLDPDESKAYQTLKKMRKMKKYERKLNFVKKEQKIYRKQQRRIEEAKSKIPVFNEKECVEIKKIRQEIKLWKRLSKIEPSEEIFSKEELAEIQKMLNDLNDTPAILI